MSEAWGSAWEPQRSGAVRATSGSTPNVLYNPLPVEYFTTPTILYYYYTPLHSNFFTGAFVSCRIHRLAIFERREPMGALLLHPPYHSNFFTVTIHRRRTVALSSAWIVLFC